MCRIDIRRADQGFYISGIEHQRPLEKCPRLRHVFGAHPLVKPGSALKNQVRRIWTQRAFGAPRLSLNKLGIQCVRKPRHDFVLHIE
jgi:hypothetical protein